MPLSKENRAEQTNNKSDYIIFLKEFSYHECKLSIV